MTIGSETSIEVTFKEDHEWTYGENDAIGREFSARVSYPAKVAKIEGRLALSTDSAKKDALITLTKPAIDDHIKLGIRDRSDFIDQIVNPNHDTAEFAGKMLLSRFPYEYMYEQAVESTKR